MTTCPGHATCLDQIPDKRALLDPSAELQKKNGSEVATPGAVRNMSTQKPSTAKKSPSQVHPVILVREFRHPEVGGAEQLVLFALASRMQTIDSDVWPSIPTIAEDTRSSESTARRAVHRLIELGILVEQPANRRSRTFRLHLTTGVNLTGHPSNLTPSQGDTDPFQIDRVGCQSERGRGVKLTGEEKEEETSEAKEKIRLADSRATQVSPSPAPHSHSIERIIAVIANSTELTSTSLRGSTPEQLAHDIASAVPGKDPSKKLQALAKWIHDKGATVSAQKLLNMVIADADRLPRVECPSLEPKPHPVAVDFSTQPLPPTRMIRVKF